jgi:uncharacterized coiled-coil protein SlyX
MRLSAPGAQSCRSLKSSTLEPDEISLLDKESAIDIMVSDKEDAADHDDRIAALERNIALQRRLIESLLARKQSVTIAERMLRRLEARLSKLQLTDRQNPESTIDQADLNARDGDD